jgi:hypothetical protein
MYSKASTNDESNNRCKDYQTYFKLKQENSSDYEGVKDENGGLQCSNTRKRKNKRK